jgi:hypothetical protein
MAQVLRRTEKGGRLPLSHGGMQARVIVCVGTEGWEGRRDKFGFGYEVDWALFCGGVDVEPDHCHEGGVSVGVLPSRLRDSLAESCDFLPVVRFAEEDQRMVVDCYSLESPPLDPLDKD